MFVKKFCIIRSDSLFAYPTFHQVIGPPFETQRSILNFLYLNAIFVLVHRRKAVFANEHHRVYIRSQYLLARKFYEQMSLVNQHLNQVHPFLTSRMLERHLYEIMLDGRLVEKQSL